MCRLGEGETIVMFTSFPLPANETARAAEIADHIPEKPEPAMTISFFTSQIALEGLLTTLYLHKIIGVTGRMS